MFLCHICCLISERVKESHLFIFGDLGMFCTYGGTLWGMGGMGHRSVAISIGKIWFETIEFGSCTQNLHIYFRQYIPMKKYIL